MIKIKVIENKLTKFIKNSSKGRKDKIRLTTFTMEDDAISFVMPLLNNTIENSKLTDEVVAKTDDKKTKYYRRNKDI